MRTTEETVRVETLVCSVFSVVGSVFASSVDAGLVSRLTVEAWSAPADTLLSSRTVSRRLLAFVGKDELYKVIGAPIERCGVRDQAPSACTTITGGLWAA